MSDTILAYHFLSDTGLTRDGLKVEPGQTLHVKPPLRMCEHGLHASIRILDALRYAPGARLCRVQLSGEILRDTDKLVATERTCLWMCDATRVLHEFACWCAEQALEREQREPDVRSWAVITAKRSWLDGAISDSDLNVTREAAREAAKEAAREADGATWSAAWAAAWAAADAAAWAAAAAAVDAAVDAAAWAAADADDAADAAAWSAAWSAAKNAAFNAHNQQLEAMIMAAHDKGVI